LTARTALWQFRWKEWPDVSALFRIGGYPL
jgi:hypothetical protein